jgi:hypothetical protein
MANDEKRFVRLPLAVRDDRRLSFAAVMAYAQLAEIASLKDGRAIMSLATLAKRMRRGRSAAREALRELVEAGHVHSDAARKGRVGSYTLTHPLFRTSTHPENQTGSSEKPDGTRPEKGTHSKLLLSKLNSLQPETKKTTTGGDGNSEVLIELVRRSGFIGTAEMEAGSAARRCDFPGGVWRLTNWLAYANAKAIAEDRIDFAVRQTMRGEHLGELNEADSDAIKAELAAAHHALRDRESGSRARNSLRRISRWA